MSLSSPCSGENVAVRIVNGNRLFEFARLPQEGPISVDEMLVTQCCELQCNLFVRLADVFQMRGAIFHSLPHGMRSSAMPAAINRAIRTHIRSRCHLAPDGSLNFDSRLGGAHVCKLFMAWALGISYTKLRNALEDAMTGRPDVHGRTGQLYPTRDTMDGLANFQAFVDQFGQHSPTGGVLMSANITRKDALSTPKGRLLRPATVRRYLGKGVRFRSMDTHLRCNVCISLKDVIAKSSGVEKERFIHLNNLHNRHVLEENLIVRKADQLGRDRPHKITSIKADGCGRERTKMPIMRRRPKSMPDAELIMADVFGVQISCKPGPASSSMHHNYDQIVPMDAFSHSTTNHYLTCILRAIVQEEVLGTTWVVLLDNAPCNKTSTMFSTLGYVLEQVPNLETIFVLFSSVGHTHNELDGHFGTMTTNVLPKRDLMTPQELISALSALAGCTAGFAQRPFLFEEALDGKMVEFDGLQQSFFYRIFRGPDNEAMFESDLCMRGDFLGGREEFKGVVHHLFKDGRESRENLEVGLSAFCEEPFKVQLKNWKKNTVGFATAEHSNEMDSIRAIVEEEPASSLSDLLSSINGKIQPISSTDHADERAFVIEALKAANYKTGRDRKTVKVDNTDKKRKQRAARALKNKK